MIHITQSAREKSQELIDLFIPIVMNEKIATLCAIETAKELLQMYIGNGYSIGKYKEYPSYWEQVIICLEDRL